MIVRDFTEMGDAAAMPAGLPIDASLRHVTLTCSEELLLLLVPLEDDHEQPLPGEMPRENVLFTEMVSTWVGGGPQPPVPVASLVTVPLYGCYVAWTPGRAAVIGPPARLALLATAVTDFANGEAELRHLEQRCARLVDGLEGDASRTFELHKPSPSHREELAARFREAVAVCGRLALLAPVVHAPPIHPPTLASQLSERLRDRTRLAERHEFAVDRAEIAERIYEGCGQRAADFSIARSQLTLEWAIVVLLIVQTVLLVVDLLSRGGST